MRTLRRVGVVISVLICAGLLGLAVGCGFGDRSLARELRQLGAKEGLALLRAQSNYIEVVTFDGKEMLIDNPRDVSAAWFSSSRHTVAWDINSLPDNTYAACPSPIIVEASDGTQIWQLPGNLINSEAMGVSNDGRRVAFHGEYYPSGSSSPVVGLQVADQGTNTVKLIAAVGPGSYGVGSISWSPDGNSFVYDSQKQIYAYEVSSGESKPLARGSNPAWSPDGKWVAFRSPDGAGYVISPDTKESKQLIPGRKVLWGIHWSPDGQYVMFGEEIGFFSNLLKGRMPIPGATGQMVVYRLRDGASLPVYWFGFKGGSDRGFYWVKDHQTFLKNASVPPVIKPCG